MDKNTGVTVSAWKRDCFICIGHVCISFINGLSQCLKNWLIFFVFILEILFLYIDNNSLSVR